MPPILFRIAFQLVAFYNSKTGCCTYDQRDSKGMYSVEEECSDDCKAFAETWDQLKLKKVNTGLVDVSTDEGVVIAKKVNAYFSGTPSIKLFKSATMAVTIQDGPASKSEYKGTGLRPAPRIKKALKQEVKGLEEKGGKFLKKNGAKEPWHESIQYSYTHSKDADICYEANWCRHSSGIPSNCGVWTRSCSCSCDYVERRKDRRDSGIDVFPAGNKW